MKKIYLCALLLMLSIGNVANGRVNEPVRTEESEMDDDTSIHQLDMLMDEALSHLGTRYRSGAKGPNAFDCSGFTSYVFKQQADVFIGASSRDQYARNIPISRSELQCGDLVFFTSPHSRGGVGHVGIVVEVDPETHHFIFVHASSRDGVKISSSDDSGYANRYVGARRVDF